MPYIVSYQKHIDPIRTIELKLPMDSQGQSLGTVLATIGETTYVSLPDQAALSSDQPAEIVGSIVNPVVLTGEIEAQIRAASPHLRLISQRMIDQIRAAYSIDDEMYFARIGVGAATGLYLPTEAEMNEMTVFGEFVESVRDWGRGERAKLGF